MFSTEITMLDPNTIQINRETRQRRIIDTTDLLDSIRQHGVMNPIIITRETIDNSMGKYYIDYLIAGERRLECCKELKIQVPCRYLETLDQETREIIELEENLKRKELPWRDHINAIGHLHNLYISKDKSWTRQQTAAQIPISPTTLNKWLTIYENIDSKYLNQAENLNQALTITQRFISEQKQSLNDKIESFGAKTFTKPLTLPDYLKPKTPKILELNSSELNIFEEEPTTPEIIKHTNFTTWANTYSGEKFDFIHCDLPIQNYIQNINTLFGNMQRILNKKYTIILWLHPHLISDIDLIISHLQVIKPPLIWYKTDLNNVYNVCEYAYLIGDIENLKPNIFAHPEASILKSSSKPESVYKYFFYMAGVRDKRFLDPLCGNAMSLKCAEDLGARYIFGLEPNENMAKKSNDFILKSRILRK